MNIRFMAALDHMISHQEAEEVLPEKVPSSLVRQIKKGNKHAQCLL